MFPVLSDHRSTSLHSSLFSLFITHVLSLRVPCKLPHADTLTPASLPRLLLTYRVIQQVVPHSNSPDRVFPLISTQTAAPLQKHSSTLLYSLLIPLFSLHFSSHCLLLSFFHFFFLCSFFLLLYFPLYSSFFFSFFRFSFMSFPSSSSSLLLYILSTASSSLLHSLSLSTTRNSDSLPLHLFLFLLFLLFFLL